MIDFVGLFPFLKIILRVAMETKHSHIAKTKLFKDNFVLHFWGPNKQFGTHEKLSLGVQGRQNWTGPGYHSNIRLMML